jgi:alpha-glucosidase
LAFCFCTSLAVSQPAAPEHALHSPDGQITITLHTDGPLGYSVRVDDKPVVSRSRLGLEFADGKQLGEHATLLGEERQTVYRLWENRFGKNRSVCDHCNELRLSLREPGSPPREFSVVARAYNDGVAFRYMLPAQPGLDSFVVARELTQFTFTADQPLWAGSQKGGFKGPQEWEFAPKKLSELDAKQPYGTPLLVQTPAAFVAITEADLRDWAGLWLGPAPAGAKFQLVARLAPRLDKQGCVVAKTPCHSPWRTLIIGRHAADLIASDLVLNLSTPSQLADISWIHPGMMAWDHWWSGDVKMDTATLKQYIQLAAEMGWTYQLIDWQWYGAFNKPTADITRVNPAVDMAEVRRFAQEKGIRLWLWLYWTDADRNDAWKKAFALYEQWGIAGVKIDFMDRDDQEMVNWYEKIARGAAEHHLLLNFHGAHKPAGLNRTWPNQITREGVMGNEYNKFSNRVTPEHKATLPFTRMLAGPADFTPGGFLNRQPAQFRQQLPALVQGTRANELALFLVYDSPVTCVCDSPEHYANQPGADFLKRVPTVWDETRGLAGEVGHYVVVARRSGKDWFLGAITDRSARELTVPLGFLGAGTWKAQSWDDAPDADRNAEHLVTAERTVRPAETLHLKLAPAGGSAVIFTLSGISK